MFKKNNCFWKYLSFFLHHCCERRDSIEVWLLKVPNVVYFLGMHMSMSSTKRTYKGVLKSNMAKIAFSSLCMAISALIHQIINNRVSFLVHKLNNPNNTATVPTFKYISSDYIAELTHIFNKTISSHNQKLPLKMH